MAFATISNEEKKDNSKKVITCFNCKKLGHYSNEYDKEDTVETSNKQGSNFLVLNETDITAAQKKNP